MSSLLLTRFNHGVKDLYHPCAGTFGLLDMPSGRKFWTVERPWVGNAAFISCVPPGVYPLQRRQSPKVKMLSRGRWTTGFEIADVRDRSLVMFHPANWPDDLNGCVGIGMKYGVLDGRLAVIDSQVAFDLFMGELVQDYYEIHIVDHTTEYP